MLKFMLKRLLFVLVLSFSFVSGLFSQLDGISFQALGYSYNETVIDMNEVYNISFADGIFVHTILDTEGYLKDSQIYNLVDYSYDTDLENILTLFIKVRSGVSGSNYSYTFYIDLNNDDYGGGSFLTYCESSVGMGYVGYSGDLKTYKSFNR